MKRDVDFIRQLLFDIERHGADCSFDALRNGAAQEIDERLRYHLRLLIDAGLAKESDRASTGQPCLRLTNAGHEFLDLCRDDARWREAKWIVQEHSGGFSLTVLRAVLTKWAVENIARSERRRRWRRVSRPYYDRMYYRDEPGYREPMYAEPRYRVESYRYEREPIGPVDRWQHDAAREALADEPLGISLPVHMI
jgi:hypothetical protein